MANPIEPLVLIILDGFGYSEASQHNAIAQANTPYWDKYWQHYPHRLIASSGLDVGLPEEQMGNSEVGHLNMGAGRIMYQEFTKIQHAIHEGSFFVNPILVNAVKKAIKTQKKIHILGLLSPGGVHSHENQIHAMLQLACQEGAKKIFIHAFLDGRDTPPCSARSSLEKLTAKFKTLGCGKFASVVGRYYAMDRDKRWDRIEKTYNLLTLGQADFHTNDVFIALENAYARSETDEFVSPTAIHDSTERPVTITDGDIVIFMNYRADRARELTRAFVETNFSGFKRLTIPQLGAFVSLTQYAKDIPTQTAYPPEFPKNTLGEYISALNLKQLRIAETEKYAHVTFFFNGGIEPAFSGEERILVPSQKVATYDLKPEMSAPEITEKLVAAINSQQYALIICNFANPDMVGHTGNFPATLKAIETIDDCLGKIIKAIEAVGGQALITADHGNAEKMFDPISQQPHTAHTHDPVPLLYVGHPAKFIASITDGTLADIAPTILYLMGLKQPKEMTGRNLIELL